MKYITHYEYNPSENPGQILVNANIRKNWYLTQIFTTYKGYAETVF